MYSCIVAQGKSILIATFFLLLENLLLFIVARILNITYKLSALVLPTLRVLSFQRYLILCSIRVSLKPLFYKGSPVTWATWFYLRDLCG